MSNSGQQQPAVMPAASTTSGNIADSSHPPASLRDSARTSDSASSETADPPHASALGESKLLEGEAEAKSITTSEDITTESVNNENTAVKADLHHVEEGKLGNDVIPRTGEIITEIRGNDRGITEMANINDNSELTTKPPNTLTAVVTEKAEVDIKEKEEYGRQRDEMEMSDPSGGQNYDNDVKEKEDDISGNGGDKGTPPLKRVRRGNKVFRCTGFGKCNMAFSRSEHLARHVRKHTGERPFQCECGRAFSRLDNLRQHIYTVHANDPFSHQAVRDQQIARANMFSTRTEQQNLPVLPAPIVLGRLPYTVPGVPPYSIYSRTATNQGVSSGGLTEVSASSPEGPSRSEGSSASPSMATPMSTSVGTRMYHPPMPTPYILPVRDPSGQYLYYTTPPQAYPPPQSTYGYPTVPYNSTQAGFYPIMAPVQMYSPAGVRHPVPPVLGTTSSTDSSKSTAQPSVMAASHPSSSPATMAPLGEAQTCASSPPQSMTSAPPQPQSRSQSQSQSQPSMVSGNGVQSFLGAESEEVRETASTSGTKSWLRAVLNTKVQQDGSSRPNLGSVNGPVPLPPV